MSRRIKATPWWRSGTLITVVVAVVLLVAMYFNTTFVKAGAQATAADTAAEWVELNFESTVVPTVQDRAEMLDSLAVSLKDDPEATGSEFGRREDDAQPYSFATKATGTVNGEVFGEILLEVPGMPEGLTVGISVPPLGSATALRDAGTELSFGDFKNQSEYQKVAVELNNRVAETVYGDLDPASLQGKEVSVVGAFTWTSKTGGEISHITIIPVSLEVVS